MVEKTLDTRVSGKTLSPWFKMLISMSVATSVNIPVKISIHKNVNINYADITNIMS